MENLSIWLAVNEDGDTGVSTDGAQEARDALTEHYGAEVIRTVKIDVTISFPTVTEVSVEVPDEAGESEEIEAEAL
jgi:hypothetical protein